VIAVAAFLALAVFHLPFPLIILTAAAVGVIGGRLAPDIFRGAGHKTAQTTHAPAIIDDDTPSPPHATFRWPRLITVLAVGLLLWGLPFSALGLCLGWQHPMTLMALFFSQAALLTFGGAYAVLPYIQQAAVSQYGWLTAPQMMDGLALGETTPGPLIMVVTFVGFIAAWQNHWWPGHESLAGVAGAVIVTWFTFLPSFVFILAGGPIVESSRGDLTFTAPLTAITAAVVGVIANLAVFFAGHVLWPKGLDAPIDLAALIIMIAAAVALIRFRANIMAVIAACATIGMVMSIWQ
jgi:chromate transporter